MDTNIALTDLASGMAVLIRAEDVGGVHDDPPGCAWKTLPREVCLDPRFLYNFTAPRFGVELPILERGDQRYQRCLATTSRRELWHTFRTTMRMILVSSWAQFLLIYLDEEGPSP